MCVKPMRVVAQDVSGDTFNDRARMDGARAVESARAQHQRFARWGGLLFGCHVRAPDQVAELA